MKSNHTLQAAVRLALTASTGTLLFASAPGALAPDEAVGSEALEEITVTGSRIKRSDLDSASPVTVIDR